MPTSPAPLSPPRPARDRLLALIVLVGLSGLGLALWMSESRAVFFALLDAAWAACF